MTEAIDVYVAAIATNEHAAHTSNLVDGFLSRSTTAGNVVTLHLTKSEAMSLQFFACEAACSARRLYEAMEADMAESDQLSAEISQQFDEAAAIFDRLPDELLRVPANDAG
jgi:hypothetical protein